jgi:hypothetical protein
MKPHLVLQGQGGIEGNDFVGSCQIQPDVGPKRTVQIVLVNGDDGVQSIIGSLKLNENQLFSGIDRAAGHLVRFEQTHYLRRQHDHRIGSRCELNEISSFHFIPIKRFGLQDNSTTS